MASPFKIANTLKPTIGTGIVLRVLQFRLSLLNTLNPLSRLWPIVYNVIAQDTSPKP